MNTWTNIMRMTAVSGDLCRSKEDDCLKVTEELGISKLPLSYTTYVSYFGCGQWRPELFIAVPYHSSPSATLPARLKAWRKMIANNGTVDQRLKSFIPFGGHGHGYVFGWDSSDQDKKRERCQYALWIMRAFQLRSVVRQ